MIKNKLFYDLVLFDIIRTTTTAPQIMCLLYWSSSLESFSVLASVTCLRCACTDAVVDTGTQEAAAVALARVRSATVVARLAHATIGMIIVAEVADWAGGVH